AVVIELYRTVALGDEEKTRQYLQLYKRAYHVIGAVILAAGLALTPFLQFLIKDKDSLGLINYRLVFILYLANTVFSYFSFAYRESILSANQAEYKSRMVTYAFKIVEMVLQIIFLLAFKNIYLYLVVPLVLNCISTVVKGILVGKWYPYIKEKPQGTLSKEEVRGTAKNIGAVALYKISGCVINSTDSIILSSMISLVVTGLYSNYLIITSAVNTILEKVFSAFTASLGNLNVDAGDDIDKKYGVFKTLSFLNFWAYGFCSACFLVLFTPFIKLWVGESYVMNTATEAAIAVNFLIYGLEETVRSHRAAYGLFYAGRFRPLFSVALNLVSSVLFVKWFPEEYGVVAVLAGTVFSNLAVAWWYDALVVFKNAFRRSPAPFLGTFWLRFLYVAVCATGLKLLCGLINLSPLPAFIIKLIICVVLYNGIFILLFYRKREFAYLTDSLTGLVRGHIKKLKKQ
ncbi:MAG: hypothetical protein ACI4SJ_06210, partial [Candidatus Avispirillum sp.]